MLEYKWASLVGMARKASDILSSRRSDLAWTHRPMGIVAVRALDQALVDTVMKRHFKFWLLVEVARVAERRLGLYEQEFPCCCMMRRMTGDTADVVLRVN